VLPTRQHEANNTDPNAPKRGLSAYMFFANAEREKVREENPGIKFGELQPVPCPRRPLLTMCRRGRQGSRREVEGPGREATRPIRCQGCRRQEALRGGEGRLPSKSAHHLRHDTH
jgi:hypothetical protein